jgi:hypothetical protein
MRRPSVRYDPDIEAGLANDLAASLPVDERRQKVRHVDRGPQTRESNALACKHTGVVQIAG